MTIPRLSRKYLIMARAYIHYAFLIVGKKADYSAKALIAMYQSESTGGNLSALIASNNGWAIGKHWMDWQISNWRDGFSDGTCFAGELLEDTTIQASMKRIIRKLNDNGRPTQ